MKIRTTVILKGLINECSKCYVIFFFLSRLNHRYPDHITRNPTRSDCWPTEGVGISQREFFPFSGLELGSLVKGPSAEPLYQSHVGKCYVILNAFNYLNEVKYYSVKKIKIYKYLCFIYHYYYYCYYYYYYFFHYCPNKTCLSKAQELRYNLFRLNERGL